MQNSESYKQMMKMKYKILLLIMVLIPGVFANVLITEVLYNPINTESGGEAIELYNPTNQSIDVSGWIIATEISDNDATFPPNTTILAGGYLLIADSGFSLNKDNSSWPNPDYEETISLTNTNAGVALKNGTTTIDAIGWGNPSNIDEGLYEGTPHEETSEGLSLQRIFNQTYKDTNNNSADFFVGAPNLKNKTIIVVNETNQTNSSNNQSSNTTNLTNGTTISLEVNQNIIINTNPGNTTTISIGLKNTGNVNVSIELKEINFTSEYIAINYSFENNLTLKINNSVNLSLEITVEENITLGEYLGQIVIFVSDQT